MEWVRDWFGYKRRANTVKEVDDKEKKWFEQIVQELGDKEISLIELGAGWGAWCMALAGLSKNGYKAIAVEALPAYCELTKEHLGTQGVKAVVLHRAVSDKNTKRLFNTDFIPFGQSILFDGRIKGLKILAVLWGILHILCGKVILVDSITIDSIISKYGIEQLDILQMDIQGTEIKAIKGAKCSIEDGVIQYMMIGTHHHTINTKLLEMLKSKYICLENILPTPDKDGLQIYKRR